MLRATGAESNAWFGGSNTSFDGAAMTPPSSPSQTDDGREPSHADDAFRDLDPWAYLYLNADLRKAFGTDLNAARHHWVHHGRAEGRRGGVVAPFQHRSIDFGRLMAKPFGLNVYGPLHAKSGLGTAVRNMLRAIKESGIPFAVWNLDTTLGSPRVTAADRARPSKYRVNLLFTNADQLQNVFSLFQTFHFDDAYNIAVWQWELAAFRPDWFSTFGAIDEVWTNSDFQARAIGSTAPIPVTKIVLPVEATTSLGRLTRADLDIAEDSFVFLMPFDVGSTSARKNPFAAIEAFRKAFQDDPNVVLILKYHSGKYEPRLALEISRAVGHLPNVRIIPESYSDEDMASLRLLSDCLLSPHRSEGFGLNIAEFLALGKAVVATNYSGNLDFFDETVGFPVAYELSEIDTQAGPYPGGYVWAEPLLASLVEQMQRVVRDKDAVEARGRLAAERMKAKFSAATVASTIARRLQSIGLDAPSPEFATWIGRSRSVTSSPFGNSGVVPATMIALRKATLFSIIVPVYNVEGHLLEACIESVQRQIYPFWELCLCNDASTNPDTLATLNRYRGVSPRIKICDLTKNLGISGASNKAAELATGEYIVLLDNDDELDPAALMEAARAIDADPAVDCLYTDELKIDIDGKLIDHYYKPDWSPEHLESVMYVLHMIVMRKALFFQIGQFRSEFDGAQDYDLMLRCALATDKITHIRQALYRWRAIPGSAAAKVDAKPSALVAGMRALSDHVARKYGTQASVEPGLLRGTFRVRHAIIGTPRVTLLILTNNRRIRLPGRGEFSMVENFVDSILSTTSYPNYNLVVVDNSSLDRSQIKRFRTAGVQVEDYQLNGPFNYAAKANYAVGLSRTDLIVLLNDDMEVINDDWLTAMLEFAQDPEIGAVGCRLLHPDGSVQHVGTVLGVNGGAAHVYHSFPGDMVGYNGFTHIIRNYSAVTGACLATRKSLVMHLGGFDESYAVDFNDIDLCLKLVEAGFRIVYTPFAQLYHFESSSIVRHQQDPAERAMFNQRWERFISDDPYYNVNLARDRVDFAARV